jgi:hypothetical protein
MSSLETTVSAERDAELAERGLPPLAFVDNSTGFAASGASVVAVRRGEPGCYAVQTDLSAEQLNAQHGVSEAQREAMHAGSMFGWDCKASFPCTWECRAASVGAGRGH